MSRVFLSHSSRDNAAAVALKMWLEQAEPGLVDEIFLDTSPDTGIPAGVRWRDKLRQANERCEAVICLLSASWDSSYECRVEYRTAENLGKPIFPVRLEPATGRDITNEWQRCDLFGDGPKTAITVDGHAEPMQFLTSGLKRLQKGCGMPGLRRTPSNGHRGTTPIAHRIAGGNRWRPPMPRSISVATRRSIDR